MKKITLIASLASCLLAGLLLSVTNTAPAAGGLAPSDYVVVVSRTTNQDPGWHKVVDVLVARHKATVVQFDKSVNESLPTLRQIFPKYACFVAKPTEATKRFVADISILTRQFDDDPYTDCFWGVLTGFDADNALRIASEKEPLVVKRVASGTEVALDKCSEGIWYSELDAGRQVVKAAGSQPNTIKGPTDSTRLLAAELVEKKVDLFVTSGHASERNWQIGFRYKNGFFKSKDGQLIGLDAAGQQFPIQSDHPRVYMAVGNCLMGHIDGPDAMALAWMNSGGVRQMIGYTVLTWYGYAGWGCLDYFVEQPGRYTLAEAFFANQQALIHRLATYHPDGVAMKVDPGSRPTGIKLSPEAKAAKLTANDIAGLIHDRDVVAFYGDPAWEARMAPGECAYAQTLQEKDGRYTLEIIPQRGAKSFAPVNTNGSQRGYRPIMVNLPHRVKDVEILEGKELQPVITHSFVLVPNPKTYEEAKSYRIVFRAKKLP